MSECIDVEEENFILRRLEAVEELIIKLDAAMLAVSSGATSYSIDTGQTRQSVTKAPPGELRNSMNDALNLRSVLKAQLEGKAVNVRPGW
jgi:hypothetical protein